MTLRAAAYCRVSTSRQADSDLSLPDQQRQIEHYCQRQGWSLAKVYIEAGASAMDDERPEFQRMIAEATYSDRPFDVIVVHSLSRFFRDEALAELYVRRLRRHGVELQSVTQHLTADPLSDLARRVVGLLDEHSSRENAKHTLRSMNENARQGYWNGSPPPLGYRVIEVGQKGARIKKRLAIAPQEAALVRRLFELYLAGDRTNGPLGTKKLAELLNREGFVTRRGKPATVKFVYELLTRTTYIGRLRFNTTDSRNGRRKPESEWIEVAVPAIIEETVFEAVQARLADRNPRSTPGAVSGSPCLLAGILKCALCGSGMILRAGKSGRYRYYTCSGRTRIGHSKCRGQSIPMAGLDDLVTEALLKGVVAPGSLAKLIGEVRTRLAMSDPAGIGNLETARHRVLASEAAVDRLFDLVAKGIITAADPDLKRNLDSVQEAGKRAKVELAEIEAQRSAPLPTPTRHCLQTD
jgi:site-specific DNA recombinase